MRPEGKALFMEELAFAMWESGKEQVHFNRLRSPLIADHFKTEVVSSLDLDWFDNDVRTCSFLNRNRDGYYRFIHRSFMEFFLAKRFIRCVRNEEWEAFVGKVVVHWEVFDFWVGLVKSDQEHYEDIVEHLIRNAARRDIGLAAIDCYVGLLFLEHEGAEAVRKAIQKLDITDEKVMKAVKWLSRESTDHYRRKFLRKAWFR